MMRCTSGSTSGISGSPRLRVGDVKAYDIRRRRLTRLGCRSISSANPRSSACDLAGFGGGSPSFTARKARSAILAPLVVFCFRGSGGATAYAMGCAVGPTPGSPPLGRRLPAGASWSSSLWWPHGRRALEGTGTPSRADREAVRGRLSVEAGCRGAFGASAVFGLSISV